MKQKVTIMPQIDCISSFLSNVGQYIWMESAVFADHKHQAAT